jgi:hypothetical protein
LGLQGIRGNRKLERESERSAGAWQLGVKKITQEPGQVIPMPVVSQPKDDDEGYVPPHRPIDKLRKYCGINLNNDSE